MNQQRDTDVVVVGSGIAGGALATVLAGAGIDVLVLEKDAAYRDKVRGELVQPWGVAEAQRLGLLDVLRAAGGIHSTSMVRYDETVDPEEAEARALALDRLLPDVPGMLNVGHPEACQALADAAAAAGATVLRGVTSVEVARNGTEVAYTADGVETRARPRLVVGADGRGSNVRRAVGVQLHETLPRTMCAGMLVDALDEWPVEWNAAGTEGDVHYFVIPRSNSRARLYLFWETRDRRRFAGPDRQRRFLDAFRLDCLPLGERIADARPAGPCASYPMNDAWCDTPLADGAVLVGDAAGWSDPIIGQGLSVSLRDARSVCEALLDSTDWSNATLEPYAHERAERMRRLRVSSFLATELRCTFGPDGARRRRCWSERARQDPRLAAPILAYVTGPETAPAEAFEWANIERILQS